MNLNFKKGALRLWIVLSVIWIALSGLLFLPDTYREIEQMPGSTRFNIAYRLGLDIRAGKITDRHKAIYEEAVQRGLMPQISFVRDLLDKDSLKRPSHQNDNDIMDTRQYVKKHFAIRVKFLGVSNDFPPGTGPETIWAKYKPLIMKSISKRLLKPTVIMFGPPLMLFIFAHLSVWIYKGFASVNENN